MTRILIVDDEESLRVTLAANLELEDFEVHEAASAVAALALLDAEDFDVVISDIRMPVMSGIEMFEELRRRGNTVPVVLMTAFTGEERIDHAVGSGVFTVLSKPFDIDHAVHVLSRASSRPHVLVVDDVEEEAHALVRVLAAANISASHATSVEQALSSIDAEPVDVCLTDLVMPGADGVDLVERLRGVASVTVVVFSGKDVPELMRQAASFGVHACLKKPLAPAVVLRTVAQARGRQPRP